MFVEKKKRDKTFRHGKTRRAKIAWNPKARLPKLEHLSQKFLCPDCIHSRTNPKLFCRIFKHPVKAKIIVCRFFIEKDWL